MRHLVILPDRRLLTPAAVRRHLDLLVGEGTVEPREQRVYGSRGRGSPARVFGLTDLGRDHFDQHYDDLALQALRFLAATQGDDAVLDAFEKAVRAIPDVLECHLMAGTADYLLKVLAADTDDFARIHRQHLARLPGVAQMHSSFALRVVLQTTALPV